MPITTSELSKNISGHTSGDPQHWKQFEKYLSGFNTKKAIYSRLTYDKKYHHLLFTEDLNEILHFSKDKISRTLKAMAALSKFLGKYDEWNLIVKKYNLKWSERNSLNTFNRIFNSTANIENYFSWIKSFAKDNKISTDCKNLVQKLNIKGMAICCSLSLQLRYDKYFEDTKINRQSNVLQLGMRNVKVVKVVKTRVNRTVKSWRKLTKN